MRKIVFSLSEKSIDNAIAELEILKQEIEDTIPRFLKYLARKGVKIAKMNVQNIDTGETVNSIHAEFLSENIAMIVAGGHACWLEFGTGVDWNGTTNDYPLTLPQGIQTYHKPSTEGGWLYPSTDSRYNLIEINGKTYAYTHGIPAERFMYKAFVELKRKAPDWARKWLDREIK